MLKYCEILEIKKLIKIKNIGVLEIVFTVKLFAYLTSILIRYILYDYWLKIYLESGRSFLTYPGQAALN